MFDHASAHDDSPNGFANAAWLRDVIAEASTLAERRAPDWSPLPTDADIVQDRIDRWMERVADGDRDRWTQRLRFEADGTFTDPNNAFVVPNSGVTLWIGDRSVSGEDRRALIQIFPGGLIRMFDKVEWGP